MGGRGSSVQALHNAATESVRGYRDSNAEISDAFCFVTTFLVQIRWMTSQQHDRFDTSVTGWSARQDLSQVSEKFYSSSGGTNR